MHKFSSYLLEPKSKPNCIGISTISNFSINHLCNFNSNTKEIQPHMPHTTDRDRAIERAKEKEGYIDMGALLA